MPAMKKALSAVGTFLTLLFLCALVIGKTTHTFRYMWIAFVVAGVWAVCYALSLLHDDDSDEGGSAQDGEHCAHHS